MAKAKSQAAARSREARKAEAERWNRFLIVGGVAAAILVALGIIGFGWYQTQIRPLSKTVLRVGDTKISLAHLERRMRLERAERPFALQGQNLLQLPDLVLSQLEVEATLLEGTEELDITVTEEEVDAKIREEGDLAEDVAPNLFADEYRRQVEKSGLEPDEYRQMLRARVLGEKVLNYFVFLAPSEEPQVRIRWIIADSEERAQQAFWRLASGEDFAALAKEFSVESSSAEQGGVIEWSPRGTFPIAELEDFLFQQAEPGQRSEIIASGQFFYIVELLGRDESRPLDDDQKRVVGSREMQKWLDDMRTKLGIEQDFTQEDSIRALNDVLD
ncbi:MAG: hypothetical protein A2148_07490 [Chloroflexi bacterium RBG_16_68_14]|nr:MAG: hypothetical protein A2148_07490 [Chloroflexi bacterium RBG_16_68_14]